MASDVGGQEDLLLTVTRAAGDAPDDWWPAPFDHPETAAFSMPNPTDLDLIQCVRLLRNSHAGGSGLLLAIAARHPKPALVIPGLGMYTKDTYSEDDIGRLAHERPRELLWLISTESMRPEDLTFAAEIAGHLCEPVEVIPVLLSLLGNDAAIVREGALYGLARHRADPRVRSQVVRLAESDISKAVREAANDLLAD